MCHVCIILDDESYQLISSHALINTKGNGRSQYVDLQELHQVGNNWQYIFFPRHAL